MKTGDLVRDPQGRTFQVGQVLGRGLWGRTWAAREENGPEWVLKVGLSAADLPEGGERLAKLAAEIVLEQGRLLQQGGAGGGASAMVACEAVFRAADGTPVLVMPRYPSSLERRLTSGCPIEELLRIQVELSRALRNLRNQTPVHGVLKPSNVLLTDKGEIRLADFATPTLRRTLLAFCRANPQGQSYLPPEVRGAGEEPPLSTAADTYAVAMMIYRGLLSDPAGGGPQPLLPADGLDRAALVALKDRIHNRLKAEPSNPRFHARLSDRAAALLNRALSREVSPSPPFRFARIDEFLSRLEEVSALVHPVVTNAGKILLERPPGQESYGTDEEVVFSCTIACSPGVETHEEIATGLALFDQDKDERCKQVACSYTVDRHPSGRFRFGFRLTELPPATYRVRIAFTIRDSGHEPVTAEGRFSVRAAPGYVPPREAPAPRPIPLERPSDGGVTERKANPLPPSAPPPAPAPSPAPAPERPAPRPVTPVVAAASAPVAASADRAEIPSPAKLQPAPRIAISRPEPVVRLAPAPVAVDETEEDDDDLLDAASSSGVPEARARADLDDLDEIEEPQYRGAGRWTELPLPGAAPRRGDTTDDEEAEASPSQALESGTSVRMAGLSEPLQKIMELARGEAYWLYLGGAVLVIVLLLVVLLALS